MSDDQTSEQDSINAGSHSDSTDDDKTVPPSVEDEKTVDESVDGNLNDK